MARAAPPGIAAAAQSLGGGAAGGCVASAARTGVAPPKTALLEITTLSASRVSLSKEISPGRLRSKEMMRGLSLFLLLKLNQHQEERNFKKSQSSSRNTHKS